jgi:hypothetical protein
MTENLSTPSRRSGRRSPATYAVGLAAGVAAAVTMLAAPASAASGASVVTEPDTGPPSEQVAPLVQPSVLYEDVTWKGYV